MKSNIFCVLVFTNPKNIKQRLAAFGIDVSKHDFLFPYLAVFDMEASLPDAILQLTVKRVKTCNNRNGLPVKRMLKFTQTHQLLSLSLYTNVFGCETDFFACRPGVTEMDVDDLVENFVGQLLAISEKSLNKMQYNYHDVIFSLGKAMAAEIAHNASIGFKDAISDIKNLKKKFITWLKQLPCVGFNSGSYDLNVLEKI